jgi:nicotinamidase-related amidase
MTASPGNGPPPPNDVHVVGNKNNFWLWTEETGFDLTHPATPTSDPVLPRLSFSAYNTTLTIAPLKTALIIVDMQNFMLSQPLNERHVGHDVELALVTRAIPAMRKANIQIIWVNWGLSATDLEALPPTLDRIWAFKQDGTARFQEGINHDMGLIEVENGDKVQGGHFLMREQWNTDLHAPLEALRQEGLKAPRPDVLFYKNRQAGVYEGFSDVSRHLKNQGITTLLFAGVNAEFCVLATLQGAFLLDFDTILLSDCCGTTNGKAAMESTLQSCRKGWGFRASSEDLEKGLDNMKT